MRKLLKIVIPIILVILIVNRIQIEDFINAGITEYEPAIGAIEYAPIDIEPDQSKGDYLVNDSLYRWDEVELLWVTVKSAKKKLLKEIRPTFTSLKLTENIDKPILIDWKLLLDIEYKLKYYKSFDMEIYAPVFTEALKAIDGKVVIIEGFVIPFDESGDIVALSANPYAACFFCGKASPASVISLYLKKKKLYKMDDFRKFQGTLKLNYDDPEEYYYILENAVPVM